MQALEKITPLDLEASQRAARMAEEDRKYFFDVERPFALKAVDFSLKVAKETLEYEEEELRQLEKMYKADDITEETEQIVLKRARDTVERAKFMVEYAKLNHDHALKFAIPRAGGVGRRSRPSGSRWIGRRTRSSFRWPCKSSGWSWRSCACSGSRPRRSSKNCWPTAS